MKKELFKEAEAMLNSETLANSSRIENYNNMVKTVTATIEELNQEEAEALISGNLELLEAITQKKIIAERELQALNNNNSVTLGNKSGELKKEESLKFYRSVISDLKEAEEKDFQKIQECLKTLSDLLEESGERTKRANTFLTNWKEKVAPFVSGEPTHIVSKADSLSIYLKRNKAYNDYIAGNNNNLLELLNY